jgi:general secretion pathway protein D
LLGQFSKAALRLVSERRSRAGLGFSLVFASLLLSACGASLSKLDSKTDNGPDVMDQVRSIDLLPRFPKEVATANTGGTENGRPALYSSTSAPSTTSDQSTSTDARPQFEAAPAGPAGEGYELNYDNAPISTVAKTILGETLGLGYTIDPRVQGTVSMSSGRLVPKSELLFVLENALRPVGVVIVKDSLGYRLMPLGDAVGSGNAETVPNQVTPGFGVSFVPLRYSSAQTLQKLMEAFATKPGTVRADLSRNMLIIQGSGPERKQAVETILSFDQDWMKGQAVGMFPIQNSAPDAVVGDLEKILDSGEGGLSQNVVKLEVVARMNSILVVAKRPDMLKTVAMWIKRLDQTDTARSGVRVYHVKYGEARQMARILNEVFTGAGAGSADTADNQVSPGSGLTSSSSSSSSGDRLASASQGQSGFGGKQAGFGATGSGLGTQGFPSSRPNLGANSNDNSASGPGGGGGGTALLQGVRITADTVNNTLLINASQENYKIIERTLRQVDRPQLQVAIDATIAEVTLNDNLAYGVQAFLTSQNLGLGPDKGSILNSPTGVAPAIVNGVAGTFLQRAIPGFNFLVGSEAQPTAILNALHTVTDLKVLSNPSLVVIDNQVATLVVGDQVPISTGSASVLNAATATSNTVINSVDYRPTGIIVRVSPRVNANGNVRLDIEQEISNVVTTSTNATSTASATPNLTPTVSQRKVKSSVIVATGQTVLLAGLIQEQVEKDRSGLPLLDDIPGAGLLFSQSTKTSQRTELIIFIRPQIIRNGVDAASIAEELRTKLRGRFGAGPEPVDSAWGKSSH